MDIAYYMRAADEFKASCALENEAREALAVAQAELAALPLPVARGTRDEFAASYADFVVAFDAFDYEGCNDFLSKDELGKLNFSDPDGDDTYYFESQITGLVDYREALVEWLADQWAEEGIDPDAWDGDLSIWAVNTPDIKNALKNEPELLAVYRNYAKTYESCFGEPSEEEESYNEASEKLRAAEKSLEAAEEVHQLSIRTLTFLGIDETGQKVAKTAAPTEWDEPTTLAAAHKAHKTGTIRIPAHTSGGHEVKAHDRKLSGK